MDSLVKEDSSTFDPLVPSIPVSFPIKKLEDLESRSYFSSFHYPFNKSTVPLVSSTELPARERILVCHDMAGGYLYDKWVQGGNSENAYAIWHWHLIDVFVYFSHNLVTLPPPCWTNAAHKNDVKVLGTFIVESDNGRKICDKLLSSNGSARIYANRLTELASSLGFDGWLLNFEVNLDVGQIPILQEFISFLTRTSHAEIPGSLVIWYDAVTINGELNWQNQLNESNKPFFDLCDGIFVNYPWEEEYPNLSAARSNGRNFDVYMGIDVFGRGTFGGGQWNTNVGLDVLKKDRVSAAIFAPGWVYETKQSPTFQIAQNRWWSLVEDSWGVPSKPPKTLPLYFDFDMFSQPILKFPSESLPHTVTVITNFEDPVSKSGGSVIFNGTLKYGDSFAARIFQGELPVGDLPLHFKFSVKTSGTSKLGILLGLTSPVFNTNRSLFLASSEPPFPKTHQFNSPIICASKPHPSEPSWSILEATISLKSYILTSIHALGYHNTNPNSNPKSSPSQYHATLGDLAIRTPNQNTVFPSPHSWAVQARYVKWGTGILSAEIDWKRRDGKAGFERCNVYAKREGVFEFVGVARVDAFYVEGFGVGREGGGGLVAEFVLQMCGADGSVQKLEDCPFIRLEG